MSEAVHPFQVAQRDIRPVLFCFEHYELMPMKFGQSVGDPELEGYVESMPIRFVDKIGFWALRGFWV